MSETHAERGGGTGLLAGVAAITVIFFGALVLELFGLAGRWDLPMFWAYLAVLIVPSLSGAWLLYRRSPDLIRERLKPGPGDRDPLSAGLLTVVLVVHLGVAALDVGRYHWSDSVPLPLQAASLVLFGCGILLTLWAELTNRFFSSAVRLQEDRGQYVVTSGPYAYVRHPGYSGGLLLFVFSGPALGSWWASALMLIAIARILQRTALEDRMLQRGLPGYGEYAARVRYRLVPGVW